MGILQKFNKWGIEINICAKECKVSKIILREISITIRIQMTIEQYFIKKIIKNILFDPSQQILDVIIYQMEVKINKQGRKFE